MKRTTKFIAILTLLFTMTSLVPSLGMDAAAAAVNVTYRVRTAASGWLPEVVNTNDYAGIIGQPITDIAIKVSSGSITYRVHNKGGAWLPYVTGYNISDTNNGYAGTAQTIDLIEAIYTPPSGSSTAIYYQVSPVNSDYYSVQVNNQVTSTMDGYAGASGISIDRLKMWIPDPASSIVNNNLPKGSFDTLTASTGNIYVRGWAIDDDLKTQSVEIHVYIGGPAGVGEGHVVGPAKVYRPDVGTAYPGAGDYHGFDTTIQTNLTGAQTVYVYAINIDSKGSIGGTNPLIATKTVTIPGASTGGKLATPLKGVDVSVHNGTVDFGALKNAGITFVIIRVGYGDDIAAQDDSTFSRNVSECQRLGIPWGAYLYSYATTVANASSEANHMKRLLNAQKALGYRPSFPVCYDVEDPSAPYGQTLISICTTFLSNIETSGYYASLYSSRSWLNDSNRLNSTSLDKYDKWVADWASSCSYLKSYGIWQFTDSLNIGGHIFDGNYAYIDYPTVIKSAHLNGW